MSADTKNLSASVHARLLNLAKERKRPFQEILQYYAMERFLYRLSKSEYQDRFVLKGALMFTAWGIPSRRPTRDIDLRGYVNNALDQVVLIVQEICKQYVEPDGMTFDHENIRAEIIQEVATYQGVRVRFIGYLGRAKAHMQLDIGFEDEISPEAIDLEYPVILDASRPVLKAYPPETVIAEKLQAIVILGEINSRMKDFYDIWLLSHQYSFDGQRLSEAIQKTFERRETDIPHEAPTGLTKKFAQEKQDRWMNFLRNYFDDDYASLEDFARVIEKIQRFLFPVMEMLDEDKYLESSWHPSSGWE